MLANFFAPRINVRAEFQISPNAKILSKVKTIGELKNKFPNLNFVKYVYIDPLDGCLKGTNPPEDIPLVPKAYITVVGTLGDIKMLAKEATA